MTCAAVAPAAKPLQGWRARTWGWVLFLALFKGLIPHVAIASVVMPGEPALVWCAPGAAPSAMPMTSASHDCACAAAADGALPPSRVVSPISARSERVALPLRHLAGASSPRLRPPVRGPPPV